MGEDFFDIGTDYKKLTILPQITEDKKMCFLLFLIWINMFKIDK